MSTDRDRLWRNLDVAFEEAVQPLRREPGPFGVLFSAGVDSALLAWELRGRPEVELYTLGQEQSSDVRAGAAGAKTIGLPWRSLPVELGSVEIAERRFADELAGLSNVGRSVLLTLALAIEEAPAARLVCGQGVDELFLGYAHYRDLSGEEAEQRSLDDMARARTTDWPRTQRVAEKVGKIVWAPYLSPSFEAAARQVPIELRLPGDRPKRFFREWAVARGLPPQLADRPKKAVQYGSGVDAMLWKLRRARRSTTPPRGYPPPPAAPEPGKECR